MASTPPEPITAQKRAQIIRQQQQRLLLLRHASGCRHENGKCPVTPHCARMKWLWRHINDAKCKDPQCQVAHCVSSRYVLSHYRRCKDPRCAVCGPVRQVIQRNHEKAKQLAIEKARQLAMPCDVTATTPPPPPPASKPVDDQRARRISIAAAVAEAAAKDVPPSERVSDNERACSALKVLMRAILLDDDDEDQRNLTEYVGYFNGRIPPVEFVKRVKCWPRLRKYWPRLRRRFCSGCGKGTLDLAAPRLLVCGGCGQGHGVGRYCSVACQRKHWPKHQKYCPRLDF